MATDKDRNLIEYEVVAQEAVIGDGTVFTLKPTPRGLPSVVLWIPGDGDLDAEDAIRGRLRLNAAVFLSDPRRTEGDA